MKLFGLTVIPLNVNSSFLLFRQEIPEPFSAVAAQGCTYPQVSDERRKVQLEFQGCFPPNTKWYRNRDQYSNCRPTAMKSGKVIEIVIEQVVPRAISAKDALYGFTHVATHILS